MVEGYVNRRMEQPQLVAEHEDGDLVEQARRGRLEAYNQLVLRHQARCYSVAYRLLGERDAAADATQDSFVKAYQRLGQFRGGSFGAWLLRIVINTCYDSLRRRRRQQSLVLNVDEKTEECDPEDWHPAWRDRGEGPEDYALRRELAGRLQRAIDALPADQRTVLVLSDVEGYGYTEIAEITGAALGTVKSRLARARLKVRAGLALDGSTAPLGRP